MALEFPIITTFDNKAVNKADKAFKSLAKTFAAAFGTRQIVAFTAQSVRAFAESEKAAKRLAIQLDSINLGFMAPELRKYISDAALASGITEQQLTPAFQKLSAVTGDILQAQNLFNLALDVSLSTGSDLTDTAIALGKAYAGNATSLAKLNIGLTQTDIKGRDANDVIAMLQEKYGGKGQEAVNNFAGAWDRLTVAVGQSKEAFGKGFVKALEDSGKEISKMQDDVINLGTALGYAAGKGTSFINDVVKSIASEIQKGHFYFGLLKGAIPTFAPARGGAAGAGILAKKNAEALEKQRKAQEKLAATQKKAARDALALKTANAMFDLQKIQIEAALKGKISDEQRTRLLLMKAVLEEDATAAAKLTDELKKNQDDTAALMKALSELKAGDPFVGWDEKIAGITKALSAIKAPNPFDNWGSYFDGIFAQINQLRINLAGLQSGVSGLVTQAKTDQAKAAADAAKAAADAAATKAAADAAAAEAVSNAAEAAKKIAEEAAAAAAAAAEAAAAAAAKGDPNANAMADAAKSTAEAAKAAADAAQIAAEAADAAGTVAAASNAKIAAQAAEDAASVIQDSIDALASVGDTAAAAAAAVEAAMQAATIIADQGAVAGGVGSMLSNSGIYRPGVSTYDQYAYPVINVTVQGNVTSEQDLASYILDQFYMSQDVGTPLSINPSRIR